MPFITSWEGRQHHYYATLTMETREGKNGSSGAGSIIKDLREVKRMLFLWAKPVQGMKRTAARVRRGRLAKPKRRSDCHHGTKSIFDLSVHTSGFYQSRNLALILVIFVPKLETPDTRLAKSLVKLVQSFMCSLLVGSTSNLGNEMLLIRHLSR